MSKRRRTADDFIRDMKAKLQHSATGDIDRKTGKGLTPEQADRAQPIIVKLPERLAKT